VVATGETVWYTGDTSMMAPQVEDAVQAYVDEAHSKTVAIIPLIKPRETSEDALSEREPPQVIGALIVEQIEDSRPKEGLPQRIEVVSEHSSMALANALEYHQLFLLPLWLWLGKAQWVFKARTLPKTIAVSAAVVALLTFLVVWPADFELEGKGSLQPAVRREVFAGVNGVVDKLEVNHGDMVRKGQVLAHMHNTDLQTEITETTGKINATQEQILAKQRSLSSKLKPIEENQLRGELAELQMALQSLKLQLALKKEKSRELTIVSPIDGEVITWQLRELLLGRPVQQGQILMRVADPAKDWELEIHMPEDRMGHIANARREIAPDLKVTYILATNPGTSYEGKIKEVHRSAEVRGDEGNTVLVRVAIAPEDRAQFVSPRPGATVTGKIYCGRASIGYVWFHDLIAGIHKVIFKFL
jgi:multidrug efflux pump subunit AcrA (membrane-fusion protein)